MRCKECNQFSEISDGFGNCNLKKCMTDITCGCDVNIDYSKPVSDSQRKIIIFIESILDQTDLYNYIKFTGNSYDEAWIFIKMWKTKAEQLYKSIKFRNQQEHHVQRQKMYKSTIDWSIEDPAAWGVPNH